MTYARRVALFLSVVFALLSFSITSSKAQVTEVVGATAGEFGVTPSGSASYSIPITVPPGTTGVQPKLTLQWSSSGGNAAGGIGWSIGGLSFVTRCARDLYFDNEIKGVDFSTTDRFCLNGQRLVAVNGVYGADGTEYRTAFEEFSHIQSFGTAGSGPLRFVVKRKSGEIFHYGFGPNQQIEATGRSDIRIWALSRIQDRFGNYVSFTYDENSTTGEFQLLRVEYTLNDSQSLAAYNKVEFTYETRPDTVVAYQAGSKISLEKRLTNIKVFSDAALYRDYQITYGAGISARSRITSVQECANDGTCFPATAFQYQADGLQKFGDKLLGTGDGGITGPDYNQYKVMGSGDFDGDGLTDLFLVYVDQYGRALGTKADHVWRANGDGTFEDKPLLPGDSMPVNHGVAAIGDFNGDGLPDLYVMEMDTEGQAAANAEDYVWLSNGDGTFAVTSLGGALGGITGLGLKDYTVATTGDFNGDGLTDLYLFEAYSAGPATSGNENDYVLLSTANPTSGAFTGFTNNNLGPNGGLNGMVPLPGGQVPVLWEYASYRVMGSGDFNGDGLTDLHLTFVDGAGRSVNYGPSYPKPDYIWLSKGDGTFDEIEPAFENWMPIAYLVAAQGDFNGDGLTDLYLVYSDTDSRAYGTAADFIWLSKGDGSFESVAAASGMWTPAQYRSMASGDFNGDGLTDLYIAEMRGGNDSSRFSGATPDYVYLSKGDGTFTSESLGTTSGVTGSAYYNYTVAAQGDFNGDGLTDIYTFKAGQHLRSDGNVHDHVWLSEWVRPDVMALITNGLGLTTEVDFKPLTDATVYTKGTTIPISGDTGLTMEAVSNSIGAGYVVSELRADNGVGGQNAQTYTYQGLRNHRLGFGNLGFEKMSVTDVPTGIVTESIYSQDYTQHHQGLLTRSRTIEPDNSYVLEDQAVTWKVRWLPDDTIRQRCFRFASSVITIKNDLNNAPISTVTEETIYDNYGFPTKITMTTTDGTDTFTKITDNVYTHITNGNWKLGRLTNATVTHQAPGQPDQVRNSSFTYNAVTGVLETETVEPGDPLFHTKTYAHNGFGAVTSVTETWGSTATDGITPTSRTFAFVYDPKSRFRIEEYNPKNHKQENAHDTLHGLLETTTGPNGIKTHFDYDAFGRTTQETRLYQHATLSSQTTTTSREVCGGAVVCPTNATIKITTDTQGAPRAIVYQDKLYREVRTSTVSLDGTEVHVDTVYDDKGRVVQQSEPFFEGALNIYWTTVTFDILGRPTQTVLPGNRVQKVHYAGLEQKSQNEAGQIKIVRTDALGRTIEVERVRDENPDIDATTYTLKNIATYVHDAIGQQISMTDPSNNTITTAYDIRGNQTSMTDPDKGAWTYRYNAIGLLVEQTDAKSQLTEMTYDVLGRTLTRTDNVNGTLETTTWTYDTASTGVGKPEQVTSPGYTAVNEYDAAGRPKQTTETIDSTAYTIKSTYDDAGRPLVTEYPTGLKAEIVYNIHGHLEIVKNATTALEYWRALEADERGNITKFLLGNGVEGLRVFDAETGFIESVQSKKATPGDTQNLSYEFFPIGNLKKRSDLAQSLSEEFEYDNLNRVVKVDTHLDASTTETVNIAYDDLGNITDKSDVGAYAYGQVHTSCASGHAGPHAVTAVTATATGPKNATYCYDLNGNMTSGDGRTVTYSVFDKPVQIAKGTHTTNISYGPDRARFKRVDVATGGTTITIYVGGKAYEKITRPGGNIERKHYIGDFAVVTEITAGATTTTQTDYLLRDHLGSVDIITDELGQIVRQMSFDAWGERREINWVAMANPTFYVATITTRGFTGHEQLDAVGLVHMNGRVYDPELGRFLSADPFIQETEDLQAWNRYTYVLNNPLSLTDPDGFFLKNILKKIGKALGKVFKFIKSNFKAILRIAITSLGCAPPHGPATCIAVTAATSFGFTLADGGSLVDAFKAAAFSAAQAGTWRVTGLALGEIQGAVGGAFFAVKGAVHGVVGGAISVAQGGSFLQGFAANAVAGAAGAVSNVISGGDLLADTAIVAAAGGAAAELTGGKFANGALTAAFANIFNKFGRRSVLAGAKAIEVIDKIFAFRRAYPGQPIPISPREIDIIMFFELYSFKNGLYIFDAPRADGVFFNLFADETFAVGSLGLFKGSDINYYQQGFSAAVNGLPTVVLADFVVGWNLKQFIFQEKPGFVDLRQIPAALGFAARGYTFIAKNHVTRPDDGSTNMVGIRRRR